MIQQIERSVKTFFWKISLNIPGIKNPLVDSNSDRSLAVITPPPLFPILD